MNETKSGAKSFLASKSLDMIAYIIFGVIVIVFVFRAGEQVGFHKAGFGRDWGEHYEDNFGAGRGGFFDRDDRFPTAHGATGKIIKADASSLVVEDRDGTEKVVIISDDTAIEKMREAIHASDLAVGDTVVVIGEPNADGQIEAKLIRVLPDPDAFMNGMPANEKNSQNETTPL